MYSSMFVQQMKNLQIRVWLQRVQQDRNPRSQKKRGRPSMKFEEASNRTKKRATDLHKS